MALPRRVRALLPAALSMVLAAGAALAVSRPPDPLDGVKTSIRLKNFAAAATELQKLAAAGNPDAQYLLAVFYLNGVNGPRDPATAKTWLEKAANKGSARAAFSLATLLQDSNPPDPQGASRWLARARELGFFNTLNTGAQKGAAAAQKGAAAARPGPPSSLLPAAQLTDPAVRREALWLAASDGDVSSLEALVDPTLAAARDEFGRGALAPRRGAPHPPRRAGGGTRSEWHDAAHDRRARGPAGRRGCRARGAPERQRDGQERQYRADACRHERLARRGR